MLGSLWFAKGGPLAAPDTVVNIESKFEKVEGLWSPHIVAEFNGMHVKLARIDGEFMWHSHEDTDEVFMVHRGSVEIQLRDGVSTILGPGDVYVVPAGVEHRPVAPGECELVLIEPAATPNTGDRATAASEPWI